VNTKYVKAKSPLMCVAYAAGVSPPQFSLLNLPCKLLVIAMSCDEAVLYIRAIRKKCKKKLKTHLILLAYCSS
jgi:hypothetical protein